MKKVFEKIAFILFICGMVLIIGLIGAEDYFAEIGVEHHMDPFRAIMAVLMLIPFGAIMMTDDRMD